MIPNTIKNRLLNNWGSKANAMACSAELRYYDPLSSWECYIYAMNPEDEDEIVCLINGMTLEISTWKFSELLAMYNANGEPPILDTEFRARRAPEIFKHLNEGNYVSPRD